MKIIAGLLLCLFCTTTLMAQITISGVVVDDSTSQPLQGASIYAQNTTQGTSSDAEGKFAISLKSGGYTLIVTYTGYDYQEITITENKSAVIEIRLKAEDKLMEEYVVRRSNEVADGWEKYGSFFQQHFIGNTPFAKNCTIENPDVLRFFYYKKTDKLKVLADEPLLIENDALGYTIRYQLDSFIYAYDTDISSYRGNAFFIEKAATVSQALQWKKNRDNAYLGSRLHFMRSVYDSTIKEEGFTVSEVDGKNPQKFLVLINPLTDKYYAVDADSDEVELYYPAKVAITYVKALPEKEYLQQFKLPADIGVQTSYIDMSDAVYIKSNGYYFEQKSWTNQGYWSWKNIADMVPYDFEL